MSKEQIHQLATSLTTAIFLVVSITGVLMFFHLFGAYTEELHEILGLAFVGIALLHVFYNWKGMKRYFTKPLFKASFGIIGVISLVFILSAEEGPNPKKQLIHAVIKAPLATSAPLFNQSETEVLKRLKDAGLDLKITTSIGAIAKHNERSPFEVIDLLKP